MLSAIWIGFLLVVGLVVFGLITAILTSLAVRFISDETGCLVQLVMMIWLLISIIIYFAGMA